MIDDDVEEVEAIGYPRSNSPSIGYFREQNGKYGLVLNRDRITDAIYDKVNTCCGLSYIVKQNGKFGLVNTEAKTVIPLKFDSIHTVHGDIVVVKKGSKYGAYDYSGQRLLSPKYSKIVGANRQYVLVENDKGLSLLSTKGKPVFKQDLDRVDLFNNGAFVGANGKYALVTRNTQTAFVYDSLTTKKILKKQVGRKTNNRRNHSFKRQDLNRIIVVKDGLVGMVDTLNKVIIPIENDEVAYEYGKNFYHTSKDKKKGAYLLKCRKYLPPEYDNVYMDGTTYLQVTKGRVKGLIDDATGEFILPIEYERIYKQDTIFVVTKDKKKGVVNRKGEQLIPHMYDDIDNLGGFLNHEYDGLFQVKIDTLYGLVDGRNNSLLPVKYTWLGDFENRLIIAYADRKYGLFDANGNELQPVVYDNIERKRTPRSAIYFSEKNGLYGVLNEDGSIKHNNEFSSVNHIHDDHNDLNLLDRRDSQYLLQVIHADGRQGVIDGFTGEFVIPLDNIQVLQSFKDHTTLVTYFLAKRASKFGVIDVQNNTVIEFKYQDLDISFCTGLYDKGKFKEQTILAAEKGNRYGVINLADEVLVPFKYQSLRKIHASGLFKARSNGKYALINAQGEVLNAGPFDEIFNYEYVGYDRPAVAMAFHQGTMRELNDKGAFISTAVPMEPHEGFTSFLELKLALIEAMNGEDDAPVHDFIRKIAPSEHLMHWLRKASPRVASKVGYLDHDHIQRTYYERLMRFKMSRWNSPYFDKDNLYTEDFTEVNEQGITTNKRVGDWAYDDTKYLEKFLRNSLKINGYWISSYFLSRRF